MPPGKGYSTLLVKQRVCQYLDVQENKDDRIVNFDVRTDIEQDALDAWLVLNPRSKMLGSDPNVVRKVTMWLDQISLFQIDTLSPDLDTGPVVATKEQKLRQELLPWLTRRHDSIHDPDLAQFPELSYLFHEYFGTFDRIESSVIREESILREIRKIKARLSQLTKNS